MEVLKVIDGHDNEGNTPIFGRYDKRYNTNNYDGDNQTCYEEVKGNSDVMTTTDKNESKTVQSFFYQPTSLESGNLDESDEQSSCDIKSQCCLEELDTCDDEEPVEIEENNNNAYELEDGVSVEILKEDGYLRQILRDRIALFDQPETESEMKGCKKFKELISRKGQQFSFTANIPRSPSRLKTPNVHQAKIRDIETNVYRVKVVDIDLDEEKGNQRDNNCVNTLSNTKGELVDNEKQIKEIRGLMSETKTTEELNQVESKNDKGENIQDSKTEETLYENQNCLSQPACFDKQSRQDIIVSETLEENENIGTEKKHETELNFESDHESKVSYAENKFIEGVNIQRSDPDFNERASNCIVTTKQIERESTEEINTGLNGRKKIVDVIPVKQSSQLVSQAQVSSVLRPNNNKRDYKTPYKVIVTERYIEPKKNIQLRRRLVRVAPKFCEPVEEGETEKEEERFFTDLLPTRRRSLSEGDLFFFSNGRIFSSELNVSSDEEGVIKSFEHFPRRKSLSCGDLRAIEEELRQSEEEETSYEEDSFEGEVIYKEEEEDSEYDTSTTESDSEEKIVSYSRGKTEQPKGLESPRTRVQKRKLTKKQSFIGKSISVDLIPQHNRYFSNIRNRRNGLVDPLDKIERNEEHEFITDLIAFKKVYKKPKKGLRIAKSVESFFDKSNNHTPIEKTESSSSVSKNKKKRFLSALFARNEKMEYLRETNILDDDDDEVNHINSKPKISIVEDSIKKVAGVIELYIDSHGDVIRKIEIAKVPGQSLGFFIRFGNGIDRVDGIFISRVTLGSFVDENNLMHSGDEILQVNKIDVTEYTLEKVAAMMQSTQRLIIKTRSALPLPMNTSPLLRSYHARKQSEIAMSHQNYSPTNYEPLSSGNDDQIFGMQRAMSDPNQLNDSTSDSNENEMSYPLVKRDRSRSEAHSNEKVFTRGRKYQSEQNDRNIMYNRKLPSIPDARYPAGEDNNNKSFSRAQRYITRKSPTFENEQSPTPDFLSIPAGKSHHLIKSPKIFRRHEHKKNSDDNMLSAPSNESLSSTSDSEDLSMTRLQVYPSDSTTIVNPLKSFTGKLVVAVYKLIGRLSGIDGECFCNIEVDGESKARTQLRRIKELVTIDESFEIELQKSSVLMFFIFHKHGKKQKLVSQACIHLENLIEQESTKKTLLLGTTSHVQMRIKINFTGAESYLQRSPSVRKNGVFGFNLSKTLAKEENTIPIVVRKCVEEIEKRGLELTGIYRISGNARRKKQLRAKFEENSLAVDVSNEEEVDCHILAGILKDYLRELPNPLISNEMYHNIYNNTCIKNKDQNNLLRDLMKELPYTNRATLIYIMDHLRRVSAHSDVNKMTNQNLAVCFGPVMMSSAFSSGDALDFKKQIDALEFLLNIWPVNVEHQKGI